jgi:hypothetical protein
MKRVRRAFDTSHSAVREHALVRWALAVGVVASVVVSIAVVGRGGDAGRADAVTLPTVPSSLPARPDRVPAPSSPAERRPDGTVGDGSDVPRRTAVEAAASSSTEPRPAPPAVDGEPGVVARPIPEVMSLAPPPGPPPPWAWSVRATPAGYVSTDVGCAAGTDAASIDAFFTARVGPVLGWDYQHVIPLGGGRTLWLFQDVFIDAGGTATTLDKSAFVHNAALVQDGTCFRLLHRGEASRPLPFELGQGANTAGRWFWPMGGEVFDGQLKVVWVEMVKDAYDPAPPNGLGWHPASTWVARYDPVTFERIDFRPAPDPGVSPIYGYAMASDASYTYLFGNTFEQNLIREGGYWAGPHSATAIYLSRVPRGQLTLRPEYRTEDGWSVDSAAAVPILQRHWVEFPFQPRYIDGQWVGVAAVDGYWGDELSVDVAADPWGPWTTTSHGSLQPRAGDPLSNTYHAQIAPWRDARGDLVVVVSNNARNMSRDAWQRPDRYRPVAFSIAWPGPPPPATVPPETVPPETVPPETVPPDTVPPTTVAPTTLPPTTVPPTVLPTTVPPTTVPPTTVPPTTIPQTTVPPGVSTTTSPSSIPSP